MSKVLQPQRIVWLDTVKGICILIIMLHHSNISHFFREYFPQHHQTLFLAFAMAVPSALASFYIFSGYTFRDCDQAIRKRAKKLLIPYFYWGIGITAIGNLSPLYFGIPISLEKNLQHLAGLIYSKALLLTRNPESVIGHPGQHLNMQLLAGDTGPLWFLTSLFTGYLLFIPLYRAKGRQIPLIILLYLVLTYLFHFSPFLLPWSLDMAPFCAILLYTGSKLKHLFPLIRGVGSYIALLLIALSVHAAINLHTAPIELFVREYGTCGIYSPICCLIIGILGSLIYSILAIGLEKAHVHHIFSYIGRASLTLLCSHVPIYFLFRDFFSRIAYYMNIECKYSNMFIMEFSLALSGGILFHLLLERIKHLHSNKKVLP